MKAPPRFLRDLGSRGRIIAGLVALAALAVGAGVYATQIEPLWIRTRLHVVSPAAGAITVVHLSDLHVDAREDLEQLEHAIRELERIRPEAVFITGDFYTNRLVEPLAYAAKLRRIAAIAPTYAVGGNHDGGFWAMQRGGYASTDTLRHFLTSSGIRYLENETDTLRVAGRRLEIFGAGDIWAGRCKPDSAGIFSRDENGYRIVLTHNPDSKHRLLAHPWDLMLCGHTHGGQVVLPLYGPPKIMVEDPEFMNGLYFLGGRPILVNPGLGSPHGIRMNCRPEISVVRI